MYRFGKTCERTHKLVMIAAGKKGHDEGRGTAGGTMSPQTVFKQREFMIHLYNFSKIEKLKEPIDLNNIINETEQIYEENNVEKTISISS